MVHRQPWVDWHPFPYRSRWGPRGQRLYRLSLYKFHGPHFILRGPVALLTLPPTLTSGLASPGGEEASEAGLIEEQGTQQSQCPDLSAEEAEAGGTQELEEELHA